MTYGPIELVRLDRDETSIMLKESLTAFDVVNFEKIND
jgi:hypothetical protein